MNPLYQCKVKLWIAVRSSPYQCKLDTSKIKGKIKSYHLQILKKRLKSISLHKYGELSDLRWVCGRSNKI